MASPDPQIVLKLAGDIVSATEHLAKLQAQWDSFFTPVAPVAAEVTQRNHVKRPTDAESLTGRIIAFLDADPQCHYETEEIAKALGEPHDKVQRTINKLVFKKRIGRYSRGMYESIIQV
jgi:hypothetical protein